MGWGRWAATWSSASSAAATRSSRATAIAAAVEKLVKEGATGATSLADLVVEARARRAPSGSWCPAGEPDREHRSRSSRRRSSRERHRHRRRQLELQRLDPPREGARGEADPLPRRRHLAAASGGSRSATASWSAATRAPTSTSCPRSTTLAPKDGLGYFGKAGAGHYVQDGPQRHRVRDDAVVRGGLRAPQGVRRTSSTCSKVTHVWNHGSVVRSWLLELAERAFNKDPELKELKAYVDDSGEGRWTVDEARAPRRRAPDHRAQPLRALRVAQGERLRAARARGAPQRVRRSRREEGLSRRDEPPSTESPPPRAHRGPHGRRLCASSSSAHRATSRGAS